MLISLLVVNSTDKISRGQATGELKGVFILNSDYLFQPNFFKLQLNFCYSPHQQKYPSLPNPPTPPPPSPPSPTPPLPCTLPRTNRTLSKDLNALKTLVRGVKCLCRAIWKCFSALLIFFMLCVEWFCIHQPSPIYSFSLYHSVILFLNMYLTVFIYFANKLLKCIAELHFSSFCCCCCCLNSIKRSLL